MTDTFKVIINIEGGLVSDIEIVQGYGIVEIRDYDLEGSYVPDSDDVIVIGKDGKCYERAMWRNTEEE